MLLFLVMLWFDHSECDIYFFTQFCVNHLRGAYRKVSMLPHAMPSAIGIVHKAAVPSAKVNSSIYLGLDDRYCVFILLLSELSVVHLYLLRP